MELIFPKKKIPVLGLAVSGGADSVALLLWCAEHRTDLCGELTVLTCNHSLRGENGEADVLFVQDLCKALGVACRTFILPTPAYAKAHGLSTEEAARALRYAVFDELIERKVVSEIATAHRAEDQAETVLFRLLRGTGIGGAAGMNRARTHFLRPMLGVTREEAEAYLAERKTAWRTDETNDDTAYSRNYLRKTVLPLLAARFPGAMQNLCAFSAAAAEDDALLYDLAAPFQKENTVLFCEKPPLFYRAAILAMRAAGLSRDYERTHLVSLFALQNKSVGKAEELPHGYLAEKTRTGVHIFKNPEKTTPVPLKIGKFSFPCGEFAVSFSENSTALNTTAPDTQILSAEALPEGCVFRSAEEGDRFRPFGHKTAKKLKDFLSGKKLNAEEKRRAVVLAKGSTVYAVLPYEIADDVKIEPVTEKILVIRKI